MLNPRPTQLSGAAFLAERPYALLADDPRVGKTGAAIIGADYVLAEDVLVVTTASGRAVWDRAFNDWSSFKRNAVVVGWPNIIQPAVLAKLKARKWDLLILDESHYASNPAAKRTQAAYDYLAPQAERVWCLSGSPIKNAPNDLWPMLNALAPERLDGMDYDAFMHRYCVVRMKKLPRGFRRIPVVMGGRNLPELRERLDGFWLRRTQADVGITEPIYETMPLLAKDTPFNPPLEREILKAAENGDTKALELHLGAIRRVTGEIKAKAVVEAVKEEFECGLEKIVLAHWHTETGRILREGLAKFGVVGIDGSSSSGQRALALTQFISYPDCRVFVGQIQAAGEAIDLSAASELMFVETTFTPALMKQMALRITNMNQKRQPRIRVATLAGSIDDVVEAILLRKWSTIREVMQ